MNLRFEKLLGLVALVSPLLAQAKEKHPNVVVIYVDDMGIGDIGCYGGRFVPTPNIDKLAESGLVFNQYYSAAPVSSPSRCALTTGRFPLTLGINTFLDKKKLNKNCEQRDYLDDSFPSMARAFHNAGYVTAHIGKWHMGGGRDVKEAPSILNYGFDEYVSTYESPDPDPVITATDWIWSKKDSIKRWRRTEYFVDKSIDFIKKNKNNSFFLNLWPDDMHTPWIPEAYEDEKKLWFEEDSFKPVLKELDYQIGRFIAALDEMGLSENTIVIFTSDNGPSPSFEQMRSARLRGTKNSLYEGGIRMPFIIKYPKEIEAGSVNDKTVLCSIDLYPSLCAMAGIKKEKGYKGDGMNMSKALLGKKEIVREGDLMWDFGRNRFFRFPKEKYNKSPHLAIRSGKWKLLVNSDGSDMQLFNMEVDKYEINNVASEYIDIANEMKEKVCSWYKKNREKFSNL